MIGTVLSVAVAFAIAVCGGALSAWYALGHLAADPHVVSGAWVADPDFGTAGSDPYARAMVARTGSLALGRAEGLEFTARSDDLGDPLRRNCTYTIAGTMRQARFWTLAAKSPDGLPLDGAVRKPRLQSLHAVRNEDGSVAITVAPEPAPGNWLTVGGSGAMSLVLTFYDTPVSGDAAIRGITLPTIRRDICDG